MLGAFTPPNRRLTSAVLVVAAGFALAAGIVGISGNPPGLLLALLAWIAAVTAFVHPWRVPRYYRYLAYSSVVAFVLFAWVHSFFDVLGAQSSGILGRYVLQPVGVVLFLLAIFACPAGIVVGVVGALVVFILNRRHPPVSAGA